jgi:hypothetical protein
MYPNIKISVYQKALGTLPTEILMAMREEKEHKKMSNAVMALRF